jgi:rsbT co-antagonist protein RsbR
MSKSLQSSSATRLAEVIANHEGAILENWIKEMSGAARRSDLIKDTELRGQCAQFLRLLQQGTESGSLDLESAAWQPLRMRQLGGSLEVNSSDKGTTVTAILPLH